MILLLIQPSSEKMSMADRLPNKNSYQRLKVTQVGARQLAYNLIDAINLMNVSSKSVHFYLIDEASQTHVVMARLPNRR